MAFDWLNLGTPFSWYFVASILFGAAVARAIRPSLGEGRWTLVFIYLSISVALAAGGIFVPGPGRILDIHIAYLSAGAAIFGFLAFRYKVIIGLPVAVIVALSITLIGLSLQGWSPLAGTSDEIARLHVFDVTQKQVDLEVTPTKGPNAGIAVTGPLPTAAVAPVVEVLRFSNYYFFISSTVLFRLDGVTTSVGETASNLLAVVDRFDRPAPIVSRLPGITYSKVVGVGADPRPLQDYSVELFDNLSAKTIEVSS